MAEDCKTIGKEIEEVAVVDIADEVRWASKLAKVGASGKCGQLGTSIILTVNSSSSVGELGRVPGWA